MGDLVSRGDFERELMGYLDALRAHYSEGRAQVRLAGGGAQYEDEVIPMEAWARVLWGLAPLWAGGGRSGDGFFEAAYPRGLAAGTDPSSSEYWGGCRPHDQRFVEMAAIAYALLLAPDALWGAITGDERRRVVAWLLQCNDHDFPAGNWLWFRVLVNLALNRLGAGGDTGRLTRDLSELDGFYRGEGWYRDGPGGVEDYYNAMTFHFFGLLYAWLCRDEDPDRASLFSERARAFAGDYVRLFSARGEGVAYGRSMTYRFAQAGFWSMAAATGADLGPGFTAGMLKGLVARSLRAWDRGRVCDNGGVLTIGYHYPNLHMAEGYNAAGSPMWCLMAFACLMLPAVDPFWHADPEPLPELPALSTALGGTALAQRDAAGEVTLYPSGRVPGHPFAQSDAKYSKFAYSSRFGFSVARSQRSLAEAAPDSMLAFVAFGRVFVRDGVEDARVEGDEVVSCWSPFPGVEVESRVEPVPGGHVRRHVVRSTVECEAYDCGFAVPGDYHELGLDEVERTCCVRALGVPGEALLIAPEPNTNLMCGKTLIPAVRYRIGVGESRLVTEVALADS